MTFSVRVNDNLAPLERAATEAMILELLYFLAEDRDKDYHRDTLFAFCQKHNINREVVRVMMMHAVVKIWFAEPNENARKTQPKMSTPLTPTNARTPMQEFTRKTTVQNPPHTYELGDDGYRLWIRYAEGPSVNLDPEEWLVLWEYKHFDIPSMAKSILNSLPWGQRSLLDLPEGVQRVDDNYYYEEH